MAYSLPYVEINGTLADATQVQANFVALLNGLNNSLARDGSVPAIGTLALGGYKITGLAVPTLTGDAATMGWVQSLGYATAGSLAAYATTAALAAAIAPLAPLASPPFTGVPTSLGFELGFRDVPVNQQPAAYTLALTDRAKSILSSTGGITIPSNAAVAFPTGTIITLVNNSAATQTVAITTDQMVLAGTATLGTRIIAAYGIATILKIGPTNWLITGNIS